MTKKTLFSFWLLLAVGLATLVFNSCGKDDEPKEENNQNDQDNQNNSLTTDVGVVINGVKWATRNVDAPGKFTATSTDFGMFYQWNRKIAWPSINVITDWNTTNPDGNTWIKTNDPSPAGWRVPTFDEFRKLKDTDKVTNEWITKNGVSGRKFTDKASGNTLFIPAAGYRINSDGTLYSSGSGGYYWSSTPYDGNETYAYHLDFSSDILGGYYYYRCLGFSVRAVAE